MDSLFYFCVFRGGFVFLFSYFGCGVGVCCLLGASCYVRFLIFGGFFGNIVPFLRISFVVREMCATFGVDKAFKMFNPNVVFVAV